MATVLENTEAIRKAIKQIAAALKEVTLKVVVQDVEEQLVKDLTIIKTAIAGIEAEFTVEVDSRNFTWSWVCPRCEADNEAEGPITGLVTCDDCGETFRAKVPSP